jgi:hypothetical protein
MCGRTDASAQKFVSKLSLDREYQIIGLKVGLSMQLILQRHLSDNELLPGLCPLPLSLKSPRDLPFQDDQRIPNSNIQMATDNSRTTIDNTKNVRLT